MWADSIRHTASTAPRASVVLTVGSELPGLLAPSAFLLNPLIVLRELRSVRRAPSATDRPMKLDPYTEPSAGTSITLANH